MFNSSNCISNINVRQRTKNWVVALDHANVKALVMIIYYCKAMQIFVYNRNYIFKSINLLTYYWIISQNFWMYWQILCYCVREPISDCIMTRNLIYSNSHNTEENICCSILCFLKMKNSINQMITFRDQADASSVCPTRVINRFPTYRVKGYTSLVQKILILIQPRDENLVWWLTSGTYTNHRQKKIIYQKMDPFV